jgi:hypothetical protein
MIALICFVLAVPASPFAIVRNVLQWTHRSLDKDAPIWRPVQRTGVITSNPILGGLHHHYIRI